MQVPGGVLAAPDALEFVQLKARITPAEYLGVRTVHDVPLQPLASTSQQVRQAPVGVPGILNSLNCTVWLNERSTPCHSRACF